MMTDMHVRVDQEVCEESRTALRTFLGGLAGVESIAVDRADIGIRYDERTISDGRIFAMTRSAAEMLGYHLASA